MPGARVRPAPEEAAAIVAALEALREGGEGAPERPPSRWELSGRLGRMIPPGRPFGGSPWNYAGWEGKS